MNFSILIMVVAAIAGAVGFEVVVGLAMNVMVKRDHADLDDSGLLGH
ncbi:MULTISPECIES: hypothetical protein [unclassified Mycobacterium]|nr:MULTISPECIES: hypothetical protein [unclassified Mycobacterium]MDP7701203.1 hypothetical protein [Mycobacterium sp. TY815]MDP7724067.1 hypothetical protein [Mycobacterium sp. TY814]